MTTTAEILDRLAAEWRATKGWEVDVRDRAFREARAILQDPSRRDLGWFAAAFDDPEKWAFALTVVHGNLPRKLLRPVIAAGVRHRHASNNQWFMSAAVKNFSGDEVRAILDEHFAAAADKYERDKVRAAYYWLGIWIDRTRDEQLRKRINKLSAEERVRLFLTCDAATARVLVWRLPYNEPTMRPLLEQALERVKRDGDSYLLHVLQEHGLG